MFFDLNVPLPLPALVSTTRTTQSKGKQKQKDSGPATSASDSTQCLYTPGQIALIESRIDLLVHLGYTVLALNQVVPSKVDSRTHINWIDGLLSKLKTRQGIVLLKRLTVTMDDESEKNVGINIQNLNALNRYDILSLRPTTAATFSLACVHHSAPSQHTAHIISMPVTLPRLPFHLKHTQVRTALKNGAVFEVDYAGAIGAESDRRNWWGASREIARVTKGKGILVSSGAEEDKILRAPRDISNLITLLGLAQNLSHDAVNQTPKSVVLRAQSRKTYRTVLSEPKLVFPQILSSTSTNVASPNTQMPPTPVTDQSGPNQADAAPTTLKVGQGLLGPSDQGNTISGQLKRKKRPHDGASSSAPSGTTTPVNSGRDGERAQKKKRNK